MREHRASQKKAQILREGGGFRVESESSSSDDTVYNESVMKVVRESKRTKIPSGTAQVSN